MICGCGVGRRCLAVSALSKIDDELADLVAPEPQPLLMSPTGTSDPSLIGYPPTFAIEVALGAKNIKELCIAYGITRERWSELRQDQLFLDDLNARLIELRTDGVSFRMKARLQAEEMLANNWQMVQDPKTPHAVKADLIKNTIKVAGLDGSKDQAAAAGAAVGTALQININLR